jgi:CxxC motif-containing protein
MLREFICIICPNGCGIEAVIDGTTITSLEGALCQRGREYVQQELVNPQRTFSTSVLVEGGVIPLASVRLTRAIPREKIFQVMEEIKKIKLKAPVKMNQVILKNVLDLDSDIIVTKNVDKSIHNSCDGQLQGGVNA